MTLHIQSFSPNFNRRFPLQKFSIHGTALEEKKKYTARKVFHLCHCKNNMFILK